MKKQRSIHARMLIIVAMLSAASIGLYAVGALTEQGPDYRYMIWNLFLAWLPLLSAGLLATKLRDHSWRSWRAILLTFVWLLLLPNSFYIVSDFIHLNEISDQHILYDAVMFMMFAISGLVLGFMSLYMIHRRLLLHFHPPLLSHALIGGVLLLCSFAIYLGRTLRWNSWDALLHPAGLLFDISDPLINPTAHGEAFTTTGMFFVLLGVLYLALWQVVHILYKTKPSDA